MISTGHGLHYHTLYIKITFNGFCEMEHHILSFCYGNISTNTTMLQCGSHVMSIKMMSQEEGLSLDVSA